MIKKYPGEKKDFCSNQEKSGTREKKNVFGIAEISPKILSKMKVSFERLKLAMNEAPVNETLAPNCDKSSFKVRVWFSKVTLLGQASRCMNSKV